MIADVVFFIHHGRVAYLDNNLTVGLNLGPAVTRRASFVEPAEFALRCAFYVLRFTFGEGGRVWNWTRRWQCLWRVNMRPSNGPILPLHFKNRTAAIEYEIRYFNKNGVNL